MLTQFKVVSRISLEFSSVYFSIRENMGSGQWSASSCGFRRLRDVRIWKTWNFIEGSEWFDSEMRLVMESGLDNRDSIEVGLDADFVMCSRTSKISVKGLDGVKLHRISRLEILSK